MYFTIVVLSLTLCYYLFFKTYTFTFVHFVPSQSNIYISVARYFNSPVHIHRLFPKVDVEYIGYFSLDTDTEGNKCLSISPVSEYHFQKQYIFI